MVIVIGFWKDSSLFSSCHVTEAAEQEHRRPTPARRLELHRRRKRADKKHESRDHNKEEKGGKREWERAAI